MTYLIGTAFIVWFLPNVGPRLMRVKLREEARKAREGEGGAEEQEPGVQSAFQHLAVRAYRVTNDGLVGRTVAELEAFPRERRVFVFTAGIGENAAAIRERVCLDAAWQGVDLDAGANRAGGPRISTAGSRMSAWVIPTNEELMIGRHTRRLRR